MKKNITFAIFIIIIILSAFCIGTEYTILFPLEKTLMYNLLYLKLEIGLMVIAIVVLYQKLIIENKPNKS